MPVPDYIELAPLDEPPSSGEFVDAEEQFMQLTDDEIAEGNWLGQVIDPDDDDDNGGIE